MKWYKIHKGGWQVTMQFDSLTSAETKAAEVGGGYSGEFVRAVVSPTAGE